MKREILACLTCCIISGIIASQPHVARTETIVQEKQTVIEVPVIEVVDLSEDFPTYTEEDIYNSYMTQLNNDNIESWYAGYKILKNTWYEQPTTIYDEFSDEDLLYLYRMVETEVYDAPFEAKVNVANVAFNRLYDDRFPNTLKGVVTSPSQFTYSRTNISQSTIAACEFAYEIKDTTDGALYFHSGKTTLKFNGADLIFTDCVGHNFYK